MSALAESVFGELGAWQAMLDRHAELFSEMLPGACVAFVRRAGSGILPGKHVAGLTEAAGGGEVMRWRVGDGGIEASLAPYAGFASAKADLLFVAEDEALEAMYAALDQDALSTMKRLIRQGGIMFYVMRTKYELQDAGYEEFLDSLGLAFLGACR